MWMRPKRSAIGLRAVEVYAKQAQNREAERKAAEIKDQDGTAGGPVAEGDEAAGRTP
jgi:hypothetical protein